MTKNIILVFLLSMSNFQVNAQVNMTKADASSFKDTNTVYVTATAVPFNPQTLTAQKKAEKVNETGVSKAGENVVEIVASMEAIPFDENNLKHERKAVVVGNDKVKLPTPMKEVEIIQAATRLHMP